MDAVLPSMALIAAPAAKPPRTMLPSNVARTLADPVRDAVVMSQCHVQSEKEIPHSPPPDAKKGCSTELLAIKMIPSGVRGCRKRLLLTAEMPPPKAAD